MSAAKSLPDAWRLVKFGDVVSCINKTSRDPSSDGLDHIVGLDHLDSDSLPIRRWDLLKDLPDGTSFTRRFRAGQVLFGKRRAYQRKVAVPDFDGICSGDILVFEPKADDLCPNFLPYLVQSYGFFDHALGTSAGSLSPRTKWQELAKYEFALPPIGEQERLVELLSAAEELVGDRQMALSAVAPLRESLIEEAIWDPLKESWACPRLAVETLVTESPRNGISPPGSEQGIGTPTVSISAIQDGRFRNTSDVRKWCLPDRDVSDYQVTNGDAFVVRGNGNRSLVGRIGWCDGEPLEHCIYPDLLIRVRFDSTVISPLLATEIWNSRRVHDELLARAKSSNGIYKVNGKDIKAHQLPVPPSDVQGKLEAAAGAVRSLEAQINSCLVNDRAARSALREALLRGQTRV